MKKAIIILSLIMIVGTPGLYAGNIDRIFKDITKEENVKNEDVDEYMSSLDELLVIKDADGTERNLVRDISSFQVIAIDSLPPEKAVHYEASLNELKDSKRFEVLARVKHGSANAIVMFKQKKDKIKGFYVVAIRNFEIYAIKLTCDIKKDDIRRLIEQRNK